MWAQEALLHLFCFCAASAVRWPVSSLSGRSRCTVDKYCCRGSAAYGLPEQMAAASSFFVRAFAAPTAEGLQASLMVEDADPEAEQALLRHLYIGLVDECQDFAALLALAHRFDFRGLVDLCAANLTEELTAENSGNVLQTRCKQGALWFATSWPKLQHPSNALLLAVCDRKDARRNSSVYIDRKLFQPDACICKKKRQRAALPGLETKWLRGRGLGASGPGPGLRAGPRARGWATQFPGKFIEGNVAEAALFMENASPI